ncbi:unnamed protein product [Rotaria sp. Silwood1]|nr:unnamed protein product [Rotaria sp. Silwood1]
MEQEVLNLANKQVQQAISNALNYLTEISSIIYQNSSENRTLKSNILLRCRSSSNNRNNRKVSFHHTIPRCSLPATKNDFVHYQTRLLSYQQTNQTRCRISRTTNCTRSNRTFDVQYSFSLNKPCLTKINKQQHNLIDIQNFANQFVEHTIQIALLQIDYQNLTNRNEISQCSSSYVPMEILQAINSYINQFIHSTIEQAIEKISSYDIEHFSNRFTEYIITNALSTIANNEIYSRTTLDDNEKYFRKIKKNSIQLEYNEQEETSLFNQNRYNSQSIFRSLTHNTSSNEELINSLVNNIAQQIYFDSFNELRHRFTSLVPPLIVPENPITLLRMLNRQQIAFFLVALLAWTFDAFDFFSVTLTVIEISTTYNKLPSDITWGITVTLMLRSIGAIIFGIAGDRFGRKWPFIVNIVFYAIVEICTGFCSTYAQFIGVRALFGIAMGGIYGNCAATALEDAPIATRGLLSGLLQQGYALGYLLAAALNLAITNNQKYGWRALFWFGGCPPLLIAIWRIFLPETRTFLSVKEARKTNAATGKFS